MNRTDIAVFYDCDLKWYWRFEPGDGATAEKSRVGYPTRAEAWRAATRHLISMLRKKR
jgi:hypothetical protein